VAGFSRSVDLDLAKPVLSDLVSRLHRHCYYRSRPNEGTQASLEWFDAEPTQVAPGFGFGRFFLVGFLIVVGISAVVGPPPKRPDEVSLPGEDAPVGKLLYKAQSAVMFNVGVALLGAFAPEIAFCGLTIVAAGEEIGTPSLAGADRP
jgi:hypothetical protein